MKTCPARIVTQTALLPVLKQAKEAATGIKRFHQGPRFPDRWSRGSPGAHLDNSNPEILLHSISRYYKFLPGEQQQAFLENLREKAS